MKRIAAGAAVTALLLSMTVWSRAGADPVGDLGINGPATASGLAVRVRAPSSGPTLAGCPMFPPDAPFNQPVDDLPVAANSAAIIANVQAAGSTTLHPDFGENPTYGLPLNVVGGDQPLVPIRYTQYPQESDPGPYPIPDGARYQDGPGDRHLYLFDASRCRLSEFYLTGRDAQGWYASNGASWTTTEWRPRPIRWTSSNAAGLPAIPLAARCDEVEAGVIGHMLSTSMSVVGPGFISPASHSGPNRDGPNWPVNGMVFRLKADYDISGFAPQSKVILQALKTYGMMVADIGVSWYFNGIPGSCWNDRDLTQMYRIPGTAFEVVDTGPVQI